MRKLVLYVRILAAISPILAVTAARAEDGVTTTKFAVTRDGEQIGYSTVRLQRTGDRTIAEITTHVQVRIAYITVYRYEQRQTERWVGDKLAALEAVTDDNGKVHRVSATRSGDRLAIIANGKAHEVDAALIPANLWNPVLVRTRVALSTKDGSVIPISVVDRGREQLTLQGRPTTAHRYSITMSFPQEVWYDEHHRLVKVELRGSDGSTIQYQPG